MTDEFNIDYDMFRSISNDDGNPEVALNRGKFAEQHNDFEGAIADYSNAIKYKPDYVEAYLRRARCFHILKQFNKAISDYEAVDQYINHKDVVKANIGNVYSTIGKFDISLRYLDEAVKIDPKNPKNYFFRAQTKAKMGKSESAFIDLTKCLEIEPDDMNALQQRGIIRVNMKDFEGAIHDFNKMMKIAPTDGMSYYYRGITYYKMNESEKCMSDLKRASMLGIKEADDFMKRI